jgi:hypothetical protein
MWRKSGDMMATGFCERFSALQKFSGGDAAGLRRMLVSRNFKHNCRANDSMKV